MTIDKQPKSKLQDILMMIVLMLRAMMMMTMMNAYKSTIQMKYNLQLCMKSNSIRIIRNSYSLMKRYMNSKIDYHK